MKSVQESKNELEAAIRYAENAISSAKQTIESMEFRQEMAKKQHVEQAGREEALTKQVQGLNDAVQFHIDREAGFLDQIKDLEKEVQRQQDLGQGYYDSMMTFKEERDVLEKKVQALKCDVEFYTKEYNKMAQEKEASTRDLEEKVGDLKDDLKDQREFDNEVRDAVEEFIEKLRTAGFEGV